MSSTLFTSSPVASSGASSYTFAPNVAVSAGQLYVAYLSVFGVANASGQTSMPLSANGITGIDYFVFQNSPGSPSDAAWNYSVVPVESAEFIAAFSDGSTATPLPAALPLFASGLGGLGLLGLRRKRKKAAAIA